VNRTLAGVLVLFLAIVAVFVVLQRDIVGAQRKACERGKLDRAANATAWYEAARIRRADGDLEVARVYQRVADGLHRRSLLDCGRAFPSPY
jgi:hypothetical protein